jgi:hypothetical protein
MAYRRSFGSGCQPGQALAIAGYWWQLRDAVFPLLLVYIFTCNRKSFERSRNTTILKIILRS